VTTVDELVGRFTAASNTTLLARAGGRLVVYKPTAGNRPLWDFDVTTLAAREVLTYEVALTMGIDAVPETTMGDGPYGPGAVQAYVEIEETFDPLPLVRAADGVLWPVAVLDLVVNNADRKLGHLLSERGTGRLRAIDHGLTFHVDDKLRTVLWGFAGCAVPPELQDGLQALRSALEGDLGRRALELVGPAEAEALSARVEGLLADPIHPDPPDDRPPIPWPPY
jgi:hypothetical protein